MSPLDGIVIALFAGLMLGVGWYYSRTNQSADDYVLGGRSMSPIIVGLSLFATLVSTLSYLANPGEMVAHGPMFMTQVAAHPITFCIVGFGLIPLLMKQPVTSAYEILEKRLGPSLRTAGAVVFLLLRFGWMATILYATSSVVLVPLLRLDPIWTAPLCAALGLLTATFASWGGIKAVVVTDSIQSVMMILGAVTTLIVITWRCGGVSGWWPGEWPAHWQAMNWGFDPSARMSFGILVFSTCLWYVCTNGSDQMSIQRFLSTRNPAAARRSLGVSLCTEVLVASLLGLTGVAILGFYTKSPPPLAAGKTLPQIADQLFPRFLMNEMPAGLAGMVLAAILSAAISSLSSGVNSVCAVLEKDFLSRNPATALTGAAQVARLRWLSWVTMAMAVGLSMLNLLITGNLLERCYKVVNLLTAPLFVLFFLALLVPWANAVGAWVGLVSAITVAVSIAYSTDLGLDLGISFVWMMPCSLLIGVTAGTVMSALASPWQRQPAE